MNFDFVMQKSDLNYSAVYFVIAAYLALMAAFIIPF
jgi:chromatin segregation and condensation protein Rec8/ScpA/Scc1 (kleisin family)